MARVLLLPLLLLLLLPSTLSTLSTPSSTTSTSTSSPPTNSSIPVDLIFRQGLVRFPPAWFAAGPPAAAAARSSLSSSSWSSSLSSFSSSSAGNGGWFICQLSFFTPAFQDGEIDVFVSIDKRTPASSPAFPLSVFAEQVNSLSFQVCLAVPVDAASIVTSAAFNDTITVNYVAFRPLDVPAKYQETGMRFTTRYINPDDMMASPDGCFTHAWDDSSSAPAGPVDLVLAQARIVPYADLSEFRWPVTVFVQTYDSVAVRYCLRVVDLDPSTDPNSKSSGSMSGLSPSGLHVIYNQTIHVNLLSMSDLSLFEPRGPGRILALSTDLTVTRRSGGSLDTRFACANVALPDVFTPNYPPVVAQAYYSYKDSSEMLPQDDFVTWFEDVSLQTARVCVGSLYAPDAQAGVTGSTADLTVTLFFAHFRALYLINELPESVALFDSNVVLSVYPASLTYPDVPKLDAFSYTYEWRFNGNRMALPGVPSRTLILSLLSAFDLGALVGEYTIVVSNDWGTSVQSSTTVYLPELTGALHRVSLEQDDQQLADELEAEGHTLFRMGLSFNKVVALHGLRSSIDIRIDTDPPLDQVLQHEPCPFHILDEFRCKYANGTLRDSGSICDLQHGGWMCVQTTTMIQLSPPQFHFMFSVDQRSKFVQQDDGQFEVVVRAGVAHWPGLLPVTWSQENNEITSPMLHVVSQSHFVVDSELTTLQFADFARVDRLRVSMCLARTPDKQQEHEGNLVPRSELVNSTCLIHITPAFSASSSTAASTPYLDAIGSIQLPPQTLDASILDDAQGKLQLSDFTKQLNTDMWTSAVHVMLKGAELLGESFFIPRELVFAPLKRIDNSYTRRNPVLTVRSTEWTRTGYRFDASHANKRGQWLFPPKRRLLLKLWLDASLNTSSPTNTTSAEAPYAQFALGKDRAPPSEFVQQSVCTIVGDTGSGSRAFHCQIASAQAPTNGAVATLQVDLLELWARTDGDAQLTLTKANEASGQLFSLPPEG